MQYLFRWAIVDVKTTGLQITRDEITEIAVCVLSETGVVNHKTQFLVFHQWRHVGSVASEHDLIHWRGLSVAKSTHSYDAYKILNAYLKQKTSKDCIIELE